MDSKSVINLLLGLPEDRDRCNTLVEDCNYLMSKMKVFKLVHTLREGNICVDLLANLGQTSDLGTTFLDEPPDDLVSTLAVDAGAELFAA